MKIPFLRGGDGDGHGPARGTRNRYDLLRTADPIFVEQYKNFSSRVQYLVDVRNVRLIAVTSAIAGEGKTVSTVHLAMNLAAGGSKKVVLVDTDLRKSDLAKGLRFPSTPGLSDLLEGSETLESVLREVTAQRIHVIPSGKRTNAPWPLLTGDRVRDLLKTLRERYDVVLLDTAPVVPVSDTLALRELLDGIVLVYRLDYTPHNLFRQAMEDIGQEKLLGVLLNGVEHGSERYYRKYYGKYYTSQEG